MAVATVAISPASLDSVCLPLAPLIERAFTPPVDEAK